MVTGADPVDGRARTASGPPPGRVGIFGGTFDPPHVGHVSVARDLADALELDEVVWIPAFRSPHKEHDPVTDSALRLEMVERAIEADPRFRVDDRELRRPGPSYTVDTLRELTQGPLAGADEIVLIMGVDQYDAFERWRDPERIRAMATIAVMDRDGAAATATPGVVTVPVGRVDVSSTQVRDRVAEGMPIAGWVPDRVADIIRREGLYR